MLQGDNQNMKKLLRLLFVIFLMLVCVLLMSSCQKSKSSDGTLLYREIEGGYEVIGVADKDATEIKIPAFFNFKPVISIAENAFYNKNVVSIKIPFTVKTIGAYAISHCDALESVKLPLGIKRVGQYNFQDCPNLKFEEKDGGKYIGNKLNPYMVLFDVEDREITSFEIHKRCKIITTAFINCQNLESIEIPRGVKVIDELAFAMCKSLKEVKLPKSLRVIGDTAFSNCTSLVEIKIPNGTQTIEDAFFNCTSLIKVELPKTIKEISKHSFYYTNVAYNEYEGGYYLGNDKNPYLIFIRLQSDDITEIKLHKDTKVISTDAFSSQYNITTYIYVPESNKYFKTIDGNLYTKNGKTLLRYAGGKEEESFVIPKKVRNIGDYAFCNSQNLKNIEFHNNIKKIGEGAFSHCKALESVKIPKKIRVIPEMAFYYSESLKDVDMHKNVTAIDEYAFVGCKMESIEFPRKLTYIGRDAFYGCVYLADINIPKNVFYIGYSAFSSCHSLKSVVIPDNVIYLGSSAFSDCSNLQEVVIGKGIKTIKRYTFANNTALQTVTISNSITEILGATFYECESLKTINFGGTIEEWKAVYKDNKDLNGHYWDRYAGRYTVVCTDGTVSK